MSLYIDSIFGANVGFEYVEAPDDDLEVRAIFAINLLFISLHFVFWRD